VGRGNGGGNRGTGGEIRAGNSGDLSRPGADSAGEKEMQKTKTAGKTRWKGIQTGVNVGRKKRRIEKTKSVVEMRRED